jgi:small subunit ribosomal protein S12
MKLNQIARLKRRNNRQKRLKNKDIVYKGAPQLKGITTAIYTMTPKKPNSALRKVAKIKLNKTNIIGRGRDKEIITAYIPGEKHSLTIHNLVLIIPKKTQDLPGIKYKVLRGLLDCKPPIRKTSRSKYGVKKNLN